MANVVEEMIGTREAAAVATESGGAVASFIKNFINVFYSVYSLLIAEFFAAKIVKIGW